MSVCEKCGKRFEPQASGEVLTTRVLCPACAAARAAEKMRAKAAAPAGAAGSAGAGHSPSSSSLVHAHPEVRKSASPSSVHLHKPPPAPIVPDADEEEEEEEEPPAHHRPLGARKRDNRTLLFGAIVAGVMAIGAGVVVTIIVKKKIHEREVSEAAAAEQKRIIDQVLAFSKENTKEAAQKLIEFAAKEEPIWKDKDNSSEIITLVAKAKNLIERDRQRQDVLVSMASLETELVDLEKLSPDEIADLRRKLGEIEPRADNMGADFLAQLAKARTDLNRAFVVALHEDAKSFAAANPEQGKLALQRFTRAEDEIIKLFDEASKARNREVTDFYRGHFQDVIKESDALAGATFTDEAIEKLDWLDLLSGEQAGLWNAAKVPGFSHRLENGVLTMIGPDKTAPGLGLISIGDREQWRDFVVELEFTLESGKAELLLRLLNRTDGTVPRITFTAGADGIVAGKPYVVTAKMIGSTVSASYYPEDVQTEPFELRWQDSRKGAVAFILNDDTRLKVTRMRVKELRASGH